MKTYSADKELENILIKEGFIAKVDTDGRGRMNFKGSKNSKTLIYFNYENIQFYSNGNPTESKTFLSEGELKLVLFYYKLGRADKKLFDDNFTFESVMDWLKRLETELNHLEEFNLFPRTQNRNKRILNFYREMAAN